MSACPPPLRCWVCGQTERVRLYQAPGSSKERPECEKCTAALAPTNERPFAAVTWDIANADPFDVIAEARTKLGRLPHHYAVSEDVLRELQRIVKETDILMDETAAVTTFCGFELRVDPSLPPATWQPRNQDGTPL